MARQTININRPLVGICALLCFAGAAVLVMTGRGSGDGQLWVAAGIRVGLLLSAFWLAMPTNTRAAAWANVSPWALVGIAVMAFVVARHPRVLIALFPLLLAVAFIGRVLRPKPKQRPPRDWE